MRTQGNAKILSAGEGRLGPLRPFARPTSRLPVDSGLKLVLDRSIRDPRFNCSLPFLGAFPELRSGVSVAYTSTHTNTITSSTCAEL